MWIYQEDRHYRSLLLMKMIEALSVDTLLFGSRAYTDFYNEGVMGTTGPKHVMKAVIRDFKLKADAPAEFISSTYCLLREITEIHPQSSSPRFDMSDLLSRKTLYASLASWRTIFCSVEDPYLESLTKSVRLRDALTLQLRYLV